MEIIQCDQLSPEWCQLHVGRATGSHAGDILDFTLKGIEGSTRRSYRLLKAAEILTGIGIGIEENYVSPEMEWGIATEKKARRAYALEEGVFVEQVGFVIGDDGRFGCSPDGLVGDKGLVGFKCPKTITHLRWILDGVIPEDHLPQARFELMVNTDREWFDFVTFDPRITGRHKPKQMMTIRLERADAKIEAMQAAADRFMDEVAETVLRLDRIAPPVEIEEEEAVSVPVDQSGMLTDADFEGLN